MGSAVKRAAAAMAGAVLASLAVTAPAYAEPAALSGTITSATTGQPVTGCVEAYTSDYGWAGSTCSDETGAWLIDGLESGVSYKVQAYAYDDIHLGEWAQDATSFETATPFVAPATVDISLAQGAVLAGTLTMADGDPLPSNTSVTIWSASGDHAGWAWPSEGAWQAAVPAGDYVVEFRAGTTTQWAFGKATQAEADPVTAVAGQTTRVDDVLPAVDEVTFSGTVTAAETGDPLDACVSAYVAESYDWAGSTCTNPSGDTPGRWSMDQLVAGTEYKFEVNAYDGVHLGEWANDAWDFMGAASFTGPATVDVALDRGAQIGGTLKRADGQPASDVWVSVEPVGPGASVGASTSETGEWSAIVREGDYKVGFYAWPLEQWAYGKTDRSEAEVFHPTPDSPAVVDDTLLAPSTITGTIRDEATGEGVVSACVEVLKPMDVTGDYPSVGEACTDGSGSYSVDVVGGDYLLRFFDPEHRYATEHYADAAREQDADLVTVTQGETVTVDASLGAGATISGIAVDARTDEPVSGVCPTAHWGKAGSWVRRIGSECSDEQGRWSIRGLPAGDFALGFSAGYESATYADTWAYKADSQAEATLVEVEAGSATETRKIQMPLGGAISGVVTDVFGNPVAGAYVDADGFTPLRAGAGEGRHDAVTDEAGRYTIRGLPEGEYRPSVYPEDFNAFAPEWSGDADSFATATPLKVKAAKTTAYDAQVAPGASFTGSLVTAAGEPFTGSIDGDVFDAEGRMVGGWYWDGASFHTTALPGGELTLAAYDVETGTWRWWYDGATTAADATPLHFQRGETKEITFHLG